MATVCQKCGDTGFFELLIYCIDCQLAAEHRYCLNEFPESNDEVIWSCEGCKQNAPKTISLNNLSLDRLSKKECENRNLISNGGPSAVHPYPPKKKRTKRSKCSISFAGAKAKVPSVRHPCHVYAKYARESAGLMSDPSLLNDENKCLHSCSDKSEEDGRIKMQRRRLVLADVDGSDKESNDAPDSVSQLACSGTPDQVPKRLQPVSAGASESQATTPVPDAYNDLSNISCHQPYDDYDGYVHAQPIIDPVWRGCFDIGNCNYGILAHLSNKACSKVYEGVKMLSMVLSVEKLPRADAWPKSFQRSPPTDDNIGLYFFPKSEREAMAFNQLLDDINDGDLALKVILDKAELLIFSSQLLPQPHSRFHGDCYLWGAFRSVPLPRRPEKWQSGSQASSNDNENEELELFPLEVEDMAVMARMAGRVGGLDLELGLGRPVGEDGEASFYCKSNNDGTADASLELDKVFTGLKGRNSVFFL